MPAPIVGPGGVGLCKTSTESRPRERACRWIARRQAGECCVVHAETAAWSLNERLRRRCATAAGRSPSSTNSTRRGAWRRNIMGIATSRIRAWRCNMGITGLLTHIRPCYRLSVRSCRRCMGYTRSVRSHRDMWSRGHLSAACEARHGRAGRCRPRPRRMTCCYLRCGWTVKPRSCGAPHRRWDVGRTGARRPRRGRNPRRRSSDVRGRSGDMWCRGMGCRCMWRRRGMWNPSRAPASPVTFLLLCSKIHLSRRNENDCRQNTNSNWSHGANSQSPYGETPSC